jgi:UDP-N-acetylmuramoylalanine--D-glutamate ligase
MQHVPERSNMAGQRSLVVGLGATGVATANFLAARGATVRVLDSRESPPGLGALQAAQPSLEIVTGNLDPRWLDGIDEVVLSPGLSVDIPLAHAARERGLAVIGDIELFARHCPAPIVAVTGSNGKSTVTALVARMLSAGGMPALAGGNLGPPALALLELPPARAYVLEISSFQMETTDTLRPLASAVLNLSADHLDRHGSFDCYAALKRKLLVAGTTAVYNQDDPVVRAMGEAHPRGVPFSIAAELARGYSVVERQGERWLAHDRRPLVRCSRLTLRGAHNEANALAALALSRTLLAVDEPVVRALCEFAGLPHRCQWVRELTGVKFIDDSKGTNVGATEAALRGLAGPFVLIAGGVGKGQDFGPLRAAATGKLRAAVLIGQAASAVAAALEGLCPIECTSGMAEAVRAAYALAEPGDTVLLSPACASFDMFRDYRHRGDMFVSAVRELAA